MAPHGQFDLLQCKLQQRFNKHIRIVVQWFNRHPLSRITPLNHWSDHCSQNIPQNFIHVTDIGTDMKEFVQTLKSKSLDQLSCCAGDFVLRVNGEDILLDETFRKGSMLAWYTVNGYLTDFPGTMIQMQWTIKVSVQKLENKQDVTAVVATLYTSPTMGGFYSRVNTGSRTLITEKIVVHETLMASFPFITMKNIILVPLTQKSDAMQLQDDKKDDCKIYLHIKLHNLINEFYYFNIWSHLRNETLFYESTIS